MQKKIFQKFNPHPKRKQVEDCQTRCFVKLLGMDYKTVRANLLTIKSAVGAGNCYDNEVVELAALEFGAKKIINLNDESVTSFADFARGGNKGKYLLMSEGHVAACVDGVIYDAWNSKDEKIIRIYIF